MRWQPVELWASPSDARAQDVAAEVPPVRSTRHRAVGRSKRKAGAEPEPEGDTPRVPEEGIGRQAKLEQALLQQMEMQKKLHEQLEVRCALKPLIFGTLKPYTAAAARTAAPAFWGARFVPSNGMH